MADDALKKLTGGGKVKKRCCRSKPRCKRCPVVAIRLEKWGATELRGKQLKKMVKRARAA